MKKFILALTVLALAAGCAPAAPRGKTLVAVFSKTGEQYHVGVIQEGNTMIVAKMIAAATGADLFEIRAANAYPEGYDETTDIAAPEPISPVTATPAPQSTSAARPINSPKRQDPKAQDFTRSDFDDIL